VARADVDVARHGIVGDAVPGRAPTPERPPLATPGLGRPLQLRLLEGLGGIPRHGPPPPQLFAAVGVIGGEIPALLELRAGLTDEDSALGDARRARDGEPLLRIGRLDFPDCLSGLGVHGNQAAIERAPDHLALPEGDAPVHDATTQLHRVSARNLRVVLPQLPAGLRIEGVDLAPGTGDENAAVDDDRCGLVDAAALGKIGIPRQAQPIDGVRVDLSERAVALLVVVARVHQPLARVLRRVGRQQAFGVDDQGGPAAAVAGGRRGGVLAGAPAAGESGNRERCNAERCNDLATHVSDIPPRVSRRAFRVIASKSAGPPVRTDPARWPVLAETLPYRNARPRAGIVGMRTERGTRPWERRSCR